LSSSPRANSSTTLPPASVFNLFSRAGVIARYFLEQVLGQDPESFRSRGRVEGVNDL
jgi:hypothetical protein